MTAIASKRLVLQALYNDAKADLKIFNFTSWHELDEYLQRFETRSIQHRIASFKNRKHKRAEVRDLEFLIGLKQRHDKLLEQILEEELASKKETCLLCFCEIENYEQYVLVCEAEMQKGLTHPPVHLACFEAQLKSELEEIKPGVIPQIKCFCESHASGKSHRIPFQSWAKFATSGQLDRYQKSSEFYFQFLCSACHNSKSQLVKFSTSAAFEGSDAAEFQHLLRAFQSGNLTAFQFYDIIAKDFFPAVSSISSNGWRLMKDILSTIEDPGCRAALQSVHLNKNPYFETLCCGRTHCFRCKTKNFHNGILCEANMASFDSSILPCAKCSLPLTKGDGCDSVVCPCSFSFSWTKEMNRFQATIRFTQKFSQHTFKICARILCGIEPKVYTRDDCLDAYQVRIYHERKVDNFIVLAMREKFGNFVHCLLGHLKLNKSTDKVKVYHSQIFEIMFNAVPNLAKKTEKYMNSCKTANQSICYALFSSDSDRFLALNNFKKGDCTGVVTKDRLKLLESLMTWRNNHPVIYKNCLDKYIVSSVEQFLYFLGDVKVQTKMFCKMGEEEAAVNTQAWDRNDSNPGLEFSNSNRSVKRPGDVSFYPAAFCKMDPFLSVNVLTVKLTEANGFSNTVSIGIAKVENGSITFPSGGSDGVGRTRNSFGYFNDRSHSEAALFFNGNNLDSLRSLVLGDEVTVIYNNRYGVCTFCLNDNEYRKEVNVGVGSWIFVVTIANNHQLTIVPSRPTTPPELCLTSEDLQFFGKNKIRRLNDVEACVFFEMRGFLHYLLRMDIEKCSDAYQQLVTKYASKSLALASESNHELYYSEAKLLDTDLKKVTLDATWRDFFVGFCKYLLYCRDNKELLERRTADEFAAEFGESAAFIAASYFNSDPLQSKPEDRARGLAYMKFYPEACNAWYEYNASLSDSLLEGLHRISKNCKCLPRCYSRRCKKTNT